MDRMNIYITTGRRNLKYAYVAIKSLFQNNRDREIHLYVVSEDLTIEDMTYEMQLAGEYGHHIHILRFDEEKAREYIHIDRKEHWPIGTMSSYWLFHELLPEEVDRIMVIESDTVVVGNLSEIYDMDFAGAYAICPGPEHKPENHRNFMRRIGGDTLTFVLSMYDVERIRRDFTLQDILQTDAEVRKQAGYSQMEFTFGLLFKGQIRYVPGKDSCIDQNERYAQELGYAYLEACQKTAKILHFSSYRDYGKPWNPVSIMPGYVIWWQYAQGSPYYREYFEEQWKLYDGVRQEKADLMKNITYRNVLLLTLVLYFAFSVLSLCIMPEGQPLWQRVMISVAEAAGALGLSLLLRWGLMRGKHVGD